MRRLLMFTLLICSIFSSGGVQGGDLLVPLPHWETPKITNATYKPLIGFTGSNVVLKNHAGLISQKGSVYELGAEVTGTVQFLSTGNGTYSDILQIAFHVDGERLEQHNGEFEKSIVVQIHGNADLVTVKRYHPDLEAFGSDELRAKHGLDVTKPIDFKIIDDGERLKLYLNGAVEPIVDYELPERAVLTGNHQIAVMNRFPYGGAKTALEVQLQLSAKP